MARCDTGSARSAGVSCPEFYRLQALVADQVRVFLGRLRSLEAALSQERELSQQDRATAARLDKYMGKGTANDRHKTTVVNNILINAERALRNNNNLTVFDRGLGSGGNTQPGFMRLGNILDTNTMLHEAIHFGTQPWRSVGGTPYILDTGNIGSYTTYGTLQAAIHRARYGWQYASEAAASYAWLVTGP